MGESRSDIHELSLMITPWERFSLHSSLSYHDSDTRPASNGHSAVVDDEDGTLSAHIGGRFVIDEDTGIEYQRHSLQVGLSTRLSETVPAQIQYHFQQYDEPTAAVFNNDTAHRVFANLSFA